VSRERGVAEGGRCRKGSAHDQRLGEHRGIATAMRTLVMKSLYQVPKGVLGVAPDHRGDNGVELVLGPCRRAADLDGLGQNAVGDCGIEGSSSKAGAGHALGEADQTIGWFH